MQIKAQVTISRRSDDIILIQLKDTASRTTFAEARLDLESFAQAITGLSHVECTCEVHGLENVGKEQVRESRSVIYAGDKNASRPQMEQWLKENWQEEGWIIDTYLGSQSSIGHKDGDTILNYSVYKFVPIES